MAEGKFSKELQKLVDSKQFTQKEIATRIGYSVAAVSTYLKGNYAGNIETFEAELEKFLQQHLQKSKYKRVSLNFEKTSIAQRIFTVAKMTQFNSEISLAFGASGIGKTTAIKEYARTNSGVIILDPYENASVRALLKQLGKYLHIGEYNQLIEVLTEDLIKALNKSGKLIIIDEAENLTVEHFRVLRKIHDRCNSTIGLLFVGTHSLYNNLSKLSGEYQYIKNRICYVEALENIDLNDVDALVRQVHQNASVEIVKAFAQASGFNARVLFNLLKRINDILLTEGGTLTADRILGARGLLL